MKFAVIGDTGTGDKHQVDVAKQLDAVAREVSVRLRRHDGRQPVRRRRAEGLQKEFEIPYKPLLDAGVKFYASLGNHDNPNERLYKPFNMNGERYYTFKPDEVERAVLRARQQLHRRQAAGLARQGAAASGSDWKICFFHHPPYSSGETHGSAELQREKLEPVFLKHGVNVVLTGHEHFYERIKPQKGIAYFILGNSAKVRRGRHLLKTDLTEKGWDQGYAFMLMEIDGDDLMFQTISDKGTTIDRAGFIACGKTEPTPGRSSQPIQPGPAPKAPTRP